MITPGFLPTVLDNHNEHGAVVKIRNRSRIPVGTALIIVALAATACGGGSTQGSAGSTASGSNASSTNLDLVHSGELSVASVVEFKPFEYVDNGKSTGFDIDMTTGIAQAMGLKPTFVTVEFESLLSSVGNDRYDVGAAAIGITDARKKTIDYSLPYYRADAVLATLKSSTITGPQDLTGMKLGVKAATTDYTYAKEHFTNTSLVTYPDNTAALVALESHQTAAIFIDLPVIELYIKSHPDLVIKYHAPQSSTFYALALPKNHPALKAAIDKHIRSIFADGTYRTLYTKYFGSPPPDQLIQDIKGQW